jgi:uncharacterized protein YndB with AHSA1/START domain
MDVVQPRAVVNAVNGVREAASNEPVEKKVYEIYIKTTPERLWQAITDPALRAKYSFGVAVHSDWTPGSRYHARTTDVAVMTGIDIADGENLEVDPQ